MERTHALVTVMRSTFGYNKDRIIQVGEEHHAMLECLEKDDMQGALKVHALHCENSKTSMLEALPESANRSSAMG